MKNTISVRGNLTKDLEFDEKKLLAKGCVAINEKETQNEQSVQRTIFLDFIIKGELAKQYQHAKKGDTVSLQGRLMQGKFNQNGQKRLFLKMQAECVKIIDKQTLKRIELFESYPRPIMSMMKAARLSAWGGLRTAWWCIFQRIGRSLKSCENGGFIIKISKFCLRNSILNLVLFANL